MCLVSAACIAVLKTQSRFLKNTKLQELFNIHTPIWVVYVEKFLKFCILFQSCALHIFLKSQEKNKKSHKT